MLQANEGDRGIERKKNHKRSSDSFFNVALPMIGNLAQKLCGGPGCSDYAENHVVKLRF